MTDGHTTARVCVQPPGENHPTDTGGQEETAGRRRVCNCTREYSTATTTATAYLPTLVRYRYNTLQRYLARINSGTVPWRSWGWS